MANDNNLYMFLTGLGVGALGAILLAPAAGSETRSKVLAAANDAGDRIKEGLAQGSDFVDGIKDKVNDAVNATVDGSKKAMDTVVDDSKEYAHSTGQQMENTGRQLQNV